MNLDGEARVISIEPCPPIQGGPGAVVAGRFSHVSSDLIDVWVEGLEEPIVSTSQHPFWSVTRRNWVPASEFQTGELLEIRSGTAQVVSIGYRDDVQVVYNLDVACEHEYRVSPRGVLVHNSSFSEGAGGHAPYQRIGAGENELSQAVMSARKVRNDRSGNNWLSFKLKGDDKIRVIRSRDTIHSERRLRKWFELKGIDRDQLDVFFSERGPCTYNGGGCQKLMMNSFPGAKGYYQVDYFDQATRDASDSAMGKYVRRIFSPKLK